MKAPDFIDTTNGIEGIQKTCVAGRKLARLEIAAAQVCIAKCVRTLADEKMKTQPAAIGRRYALGLAKERDKQKENQISVHLRLKLKIARKIFRRDLAHSAFELERGVQRVIQFFHEHNQRPDVAVTQARARIVLFELFNQPAGIVNADIKLVASSPQKRAG